MHITDAVRTTVLARVRLLSRTERGVVMRAAVIGRSFEVAVLAATMPHTQEQVRAALERACSLQLLTGCDPPGERFAFRHAVTRDVIYTELITARVRPLHRRIALALERLSGSSDVPLDDLAYHSWAAGDARRGVRYNELAGDRAAAVHAPEDARTYYGRARDLIAVDSHAYVRLSEKMRALDGAEAAAPR